MTTKPLITIAGILCLLAACAPQAELVRISSEMKELREDVKAMKARNLEAQKRFDPELQALRTRVEMLDSNIKGTVDAQKVMADFGARTDQITTDIQLLQGRLEENNYRLAELAQKIDDRSVKLSEVAARMDDVEARVKQVSAAVSTVATGQTATAPAAPSSDADGQAKPRMIEPSEAYRQAKSDFDKGNFDLALAGFQNYIAQFPDASQAGHAQYWIGECYYALKNFRKSINAFSKVISDYPSSDKVAGAKLKIGLAYVSEKNSAKAKEFFNKVIKEHPGTNEAEIAKDRLDKIRK